MNVTSSGDDPTMGDSPDSGSPTTGEPNPGAPNLAPPGHPTYGQPTYGPPDAAPAGTPTYGQAPTYGTTPAGPPPSGGSPYGGSPYGGSPYAIPPAGGSPTEPYRPGAFPQVDGSYGAPPMEPVEEGGSGRGRWLIASLVTILVLGAVIAGILVYTQRPAAVSALPEYAPVNSAIYAELRLDLPGDQRDNVVEFMSKFPGFSDPSTFEQKINDSFDQLLLSTGTGLSWTRDVEPWFGGQIAVFGSITGDEQREIPSITAVISVKDRTTLDQLIAARTAGGGTTGHYYRDIPIWTMGSGDGAFTVTNDAFIVSTRSEDVHTALDVKAGAAPNLATNTDFSESMGTLSGDRLAAIYVDGDALASAFESLAGVLGFGSDMPLGAAPSGKVLVELRAESDHIALSSRARPAPGSTPLIPTVSGPTTVADRMPPDSMAYFGLHGTGPLLKAGIQQMFTMMDQSPVPVDTTDLDQLEEYLGMPVEDFLDFLGETAISFNAGPDGMYGGGLIATVSDEAVAKERLGRVVNALRLAISFGELPLPVTIEEVPHGEATLTVFRIEEEPGMEDVPFDSISLTVTGGQLLIGVDNFVTDSLDRDPGNSLASQPRFKAALDAAGADNSGVLYVDIGAARTALEGMMPAEQRPRYEADIRPYVAPFSQFIFTGSTDGDDTITRMLLFVE